MMVIMVHTFTASRSARVPSGQSNWNVSSSISSSVHTSFNTRSAGKREGRGREGGEGKGGKGGRGVRGKERG